MKKSARSIIFIILLIAVILFVCLAVFAITGKITFDLFAPKEKVLDLNQYISNNILIDISSQGPIYGLSVDGNFVFGKNGLLRIILIDKAGKEYLVLEKNTLISGYSGDFNGCEETCALDGINPQSLEIDIVDAEAQINSITLITSFDKLPQEAKAKGIATYNLEKKQKINAENIQNINSNTKKIGLKWQAGETSVSQLSFNEQKKLFLDREVPLVPGWQYYVGGIFEMPGEGSGEPTPTSSNYVSMWDWRNRHGVSWMTSIKNQGSCGSCWAFAATGAVEAVTNVYFNRHLNKDASEQQLVSDVLPCCTPCLGCQGGWPHYALDHYRDVGVTNESCFPYQAANVTCNLCSAWQQDTIKISGRETFIPNYGEDWLKERIIKKGPVSGGLCSWSHAMALLGWETDPTDGKTVWIFKNSWGSGWGENGYARIKPSSISDICWTHAVLSPINLSSNTSLTILCEDKDNDGYCNWGITESKPSSCPAFCNVQKDCDDSNAVFGPFTSTYACSIIGDFGSLTVSSNPSSANLYVDNVYYGLTPITVTPLSVGTHSVRLTKSGYLDYNTSVIISANQTTFLNVTLSPMPTGNLYIVSNPTGAKVYLEGTYKGLTPILIENLIIGQYLVQIKKAGYKTYSDLVTIEANQTKNLNITLVKSGGGKKK